MRVRKHPRAHVGGGSKSRNIAQNLGFFVLCYGLHSAHTQRAHNARAHTIRAHTMRPHDAHRRKSVASCVDCMLCYTIARARRVLLRMRFRIKSFITKATNTFPIPVLPYVTVWITMFSSIVTKIFFCISTLQTHFFSLLRKMWITFFGKGVQTPPNFAPNRNQT